MSLQNCIDNFKLVNLYRCNVPQLQLAAEEKDPTFLVSTARIPKTSHCVIQAR